MLLHSDYNNHQHSSIEPNSISGYPGSSLPNSYGSHNPAGTMASYGAAGINSMNYTMPSLNTSYPSFSGGMTGMSSSLNYGSLGSGGMTIGSMTTPNGGSSLNPGGRNQLGAQISTMPPTGAVPGGPMGQRRQEKAYR